MALLAAPPTTEPKPPPRPPSKAPWPNLPPDSAELAPPIKAPPRIEAPMPVAPKAAPRAAPAPGTMKFKAMGSTAPINFFRLKYSGRPVTGLIEPPPPARRSIAASRGLMWASMVSPPRPCAARRCAACASPPRAKAGGCGIPISGSMPAPDSISACTM